MRVRVTHAPMWSVWHNSRQFIRPLLIHAICVEEERGDELAKIFHQSLVSFLLFSAAGTPFNHFCPVKGEFIPHSNLFIKSR